MKWHDIEQSWPDLRWRARRHWYWLTEEDVSQINGTREQLVDRVQRRYRFPREQAEKEVDAWALLIQPSLPSERMA